MTDSPSIWRSDQVGGPDRLDWTPVLLGQSHLYIVPERIGLHCGSGIATLRLSTVGNAYGLKSKSGPSVYQVKNVNPSTT